MGEVLFKVNYKREEGYLYYIKFGEDGNLRICRAKLKRGGTKKIKNGKNHKRIDTKRN